MMAKVNTKYKTVKRKANVGERILITNAIITEGAYENGDIFTVDTLLDAGVFVKENDDTAMYHREYEVIIGESPSDSERITALESQVAELQAELQALKKRKKPKHLLTHYPTPNEQRKAVIERAKAFLENTKEKPSYEDTLRYMVNSDTPFVRYVSDVDFIVNSDKRTVVALLKWRSSGKVVAKAIAKCAPDDVFNADIGKAIALGRALGLDVSEFENAVKPTEVVVGMRVHAKNSSGKDFVLNVDEIKKSAYYDWSAMRHISIGNVNYGGKSTEPKIIDDTEAQY